jgi:molybdopterin/thiamine biosynthesis adenylyltransferase
MIRPRIKRSTELLKGPDGIVSICGIYETVPCEVSEVEYALLNALDGTRTREQLEAEFGVEVVDDVFGQLDEHNLLDDAADDDRIPAATREIYDRQLIHFSDVATGAGPPSACQQRLAEATVAVLGVGALGGAAALYLAKHGFGELCLVDGDRIEISNLNRQILFGADDVGASKVEVAGKCLRAKTPGLRVTTHDRFIGSAEDVAEVIEGVDFVVSAADQPPDAIERWCNEACFAAGIPYISMSNYPPFARVGPLYVPGKTACYLCLVLRDEEESPDFSRNLAERKWDADLPTIGSVSGMVGAEVAREAFNFISEADEPESLGVAWIRDLREKRWNPRPVEQHPECPICSG